MSLRNARFNDKDTPYMFRTKHFLSSGGPYKQLIVFYHTEIIFKKNMHYLYIDYV